MRALAEVSRHGLSRLAFWKNRVSETAVADKEQDPIFSSIYRRVTELMSQGGFTLVRATDGIRVKQTSVVLSVGSETFSAALITHQQGQGDPHSSEFKPLSSSMTLNLESSERELNLHIAQEPTARGFYEKILGTFDSSSVGIRGNRVLKDEIRNLADEIDTHGRVDEISTKERYDDQADNLPNDGSLIDFYWNSKRPNLPVRSFK